MPYFQTPNEDILLIHVPKAGGSSIEEYFRRKSSNVSLFGYLDERLRKKYRIFSCKSMQHLSYENLYKMRNEFNIDFESERLKIITSVRNPYDRILSDMFFNRVLSPGASPENTFETMELYLSKDCYDTHNHPQHTFITKNNGELVENIIILKQETLTEDMKKIGYIDFNIWSNKTFNGIQVDYRKCLNSDSIRLINTVFAKDFELFGYEMLQ
jgi:hypothetical protein